MNTKNESRAETGLPVPIFAALVITVLVLGLGIFTFCVKNVWRLTGNEIGDFFAGFAGALSFVWIIATIFLQKEELALQRIEVSRLASEAKAQAASLLVAAKTNFQIRWNSSIAAFFRNHQSTLSAINTEIAATLIRNPGAIAKFQEYVDQTYSHGKKLSPDMLEDGYLEFKSADQLCFRLRLSASAGTNPADPLSGGSHCMAVIEVPIMELKITERLASKNIDVREFELLVAEALSLELASTIRNVSPVTEDEDGLRELKAGAIVKCFVNELVGRSTSAGRVER